jgi:hypothetical protein
MNILSHDVDFGWFSLVFFIQIMGLPQEREFESHQFWV